MDREDIKDVIRNATTCIGGILLKIDDHADEKGQIRAELRKLEDCIDDQKQNKRKRLRN